MQQVERLDFLGKYFWLIGQECLKLQKLEPAEECAVYLGQLPSHVSCVGTPSQEFFKNGPCKCVNAAQGTEATTIAAEATTFAADGQGLELRFFGLASDIAFLLRRRSTTPA